MNSTQRVPTKASAVPVVAPVGAALDGRTFDPLPFGVVPHTPLYPFQHEGVAALININAHALLDDRGLGKTVQAITAARARIIACNLHRVIFICSADMLCQWEQELRTHAPDIALCVLGGKPKGSRVWHSGTPFYLINYELLARSKGDDYANMCNELMKRIEYGMVLDESDAIRTSTSNTSKRLRSLSRSTYGPSWRVILTSTLIAEGAENVWAQVEFLLPGYFGSYADFERKYLIITKQIFNGATRKKVVGYKNLPALHKSIESISTRRLKDELDLGLPTKQVITTQVRATKEASECKRIARALMDEIGKLSGPVALDQVAVKHPSIMRLIVDLQKQSAVGAKLDLLKARIKETPYKGIVWCYHRSVAEQVHKAINGSVLIYGGMSKKWQISTRGEFRDNPKCQVLVATLDALSTGHNIQEASWAFYLQLNWKLASWVQSQDRIHRIGQMRRVLIEVPLLDTSLDDYIFNLLRWKEGKAAEGMDGAKALALARQRLGEYLKQRF